MHVSSLTIPFIAYCAKYGSASYLQASNPPLFNVTSGGYGGQLDSDREDEIGLLNKDAARPVAKESVNLYNEQSAKAFVPLLLGDLNGSEKNVDRQVNAGIRKLQSSYWTQLGSDIDGEAAWDYFGWSISLSSDGQVLAVGANGNGEGGLVRVYSFNGTGWTQLGSDIHGEAADDSSGFSVSLSSDGNVLAVGADGNDGSGSSAGHVRVYSFNGTGWTQLGSDIDGEAARDSSGFSVSLSSDGNVLAVGAPFNDGSGSSAGHVRVYSLNDTRWTQLGSDIDGEAANDNFGFSVSLSSDGNVLAIGAYWNDGRGSSAGHVRVYSFNGTGWTQLGSDIDGEAAGDNSGRSVSLSSDGNVLAVGAPYNDGSGSDAGHVRVYSFNGTGWTQLGSDIDGEAAGDWSGRSVSLSSDGNVLAIGAPHNYGSGTDAGHVRVYSFNGTGWTQLGSDIDGEAACDWSGQSVSLSSDGNVLAIGAYFNDGRGSGATGHVRVYQSDFLSTANSPSSSPIKSQTVSPSLGPTKPLSNAPSSSHNLSPSSTPPVSPSLGPSKPASPSLSPSKPPYQSDFLSTTNSPSSSPIKSQTVSPSLSPSKVPSNEGNFGNIVGLGSMIPFVGAAAVFVGFLSQYA